MTRALSNARTFLLIAAMAFSAFSFAFDARMAHAESMPSHGMEESCGESCEADASESSCLQHCIEYAASHRTEASGPARTDGFDTASDIPDEETSYSEDEDILPAPDEVRHPDDGFLERHHSVQKNE